MGRGHLHLLQVQVQTLNYAEKAQKISICPRPIFFFWHIPYSKLLANVNLAY